MLGAQTPEIQAARQTLAAADNGVDAARLLVEQWLEVAKGDILLARTRAYRRTCAFRLGLHIFILHHILVV